MPLSDISYHANLREWVHVPAIEQFNSTEKNDSRVVSEITSRQVYLMGTFCTLSYVSSDSLQSVDRLESMVRILEEAENDLSTWKDNSVISRLNRQPVGVPQEVTPSMIELFLDLYYWSKETEQCFDPTVGKLLEAYALRTGGRWPSAAWIETLRQHKGMQHYILDKNGHRIARMKDIHMDAGSFGKGEALDRLLKENAEGNAWMVDLGGQILVHGTLPGKSGWPVSIAHPWHREDALFSIILKAGSLATSGGSERDQIVGKRRLGHIVDPRTGKPAPFNGSVSVWHERALTADILSTALYVMGPEKGLRWADERNIAACYLVPNADGTVEINPSRAFRNIAPDNESANIFPNSILQQTGKFVKK